MDRRTILRGGTVRVYNFFKGFLDSRNSEMNSSLLYKRKKKRKLVSKKKIAFLSRFKLSPSLGFREWKKSRDKCSRACLNFLQPVVTSSPLFFPVKSPPTQIMRASMLLAPSSSSYFCVKPESIRLGWKTDRSSHNSVFLLLLPSCRGSVACLHTRIDRDPCGERKPYSFRISSIFFWPPIDPYGLEASSSTFSSPRIETGREGECEEHLATRCILHFASN